MSVGIRCPKCRGLSSTVVDTRGSEGKIRRRRKCDRCSTRFSSIEMCIEGADSLHARVRSVERDSIRAELKSQIIKMIDESP